jgi:hypothetical protein
MTHLRTFTHTADTWHAKASAATRLRSSRLSGSNRFLLDHGQTFDNPTPALAGNFLAWLHWKRHGAASCSFRMISFSNIHKQHGKQLLFVDASSSARNYHGRAIRFAR